MPMLYLENVKLNAVVAMASNGIIGNGNDIPWEPPQIDMWRFRSLTLNKNIVMGYNTWKSLPNQLPYRKHFVLTSKKDHLPDNSQVVPVGSVNELGYIAEKDNIDNMFVIGGGSIFKTLWPVLNKVYMTRIDIKPQGDVLFPYEWLDNTKWRLEEDIQILGYHDINRSSIDDLNMGLRFIDFVRR